MLVPHTDFPVRPFRKKGESLAGYLCRFYGVNGHRVPHELNQALNALYRGMPDKATTAFDTVQSTISDFVTLDRTWWLDGIFIERCFGNYRRAWKILTYSPVRFCPDCLREYGFHLALWEVPLVQACPRHRCILLTECSLCKKALSWPKISPSWSCCGKSIITMPTEPATQSATIIAQFLAGASDIERPDGLQECPPGGKCYGGYTMVDVYAGLEWINELRGIFLKRVAIFEESSFSRRKQTRWSWPRIWDIRLLADSPEQAPRRLLRTLISYCGGKKLNLYLVQESTNLNQAILFINRADNNMFPNKIRGAAAHILKEYSLKLPISSVVLFNPRVSHEMRIIYLTQFMTWWNKLSRRIGKLDPDMQSNRQTAASPLTIFGIKIRDIGIVDILNFLINAAHQQVDVEDFRALSYWWRIPAEFQEFQEPNEVLLRIGSYLSTISIAELAFVDDLIRQALPSESS